MNRHLLSMAIQFSAALTWFATASMALPPCPTTGYLHNCYGTRTLSNGSRYTGEFINNKANGQGEVKFANGDKYVGGFKDGKLEGQGTFTFVLGDVYVGDFKGGVMSGQGTYKFLNGEMYVGEFKENMFEGLGTYTFPDGSRFIGEFKDDIWTGKGTYEKNGVSYTKDGEILGSVASPPIFGNEASATSGQDRSCINLTNNLDICALAKRIQSDMSYDLPQMLSSSMMLGTVSAIENELSLNAILLYDMEFLKSSLKAAERTIEGLELQMNDFTKTYICSNPTTSEFIKLGGKIVFSYKFSDGEFLFQIPVARC